MNVPESAGGSSGKREENGDVSGTEPPLKKARFAWQVKGRYHLKNDNSQVPKTAEVFSRGPDKVPEENSESSGVTNAEQNLEILGDYLLKQDFNTLDSDTDSDKSLLTPNTSLSTEILPYPRYTSSLDNNVSNKTSSLSSGSSYQFVIPMSMVLSNNISEDQCIARWQARQVAKGYVDNAVNRILNTWMVAPLPSDVEDSNPAFDVAEILNNFPGDIENEGILMAISAHGLQNNSSSSSNNNSLNTDSSSSVKDDDFPMEDEGVLNSLESDDGIKDSLNNNRIDGDRSSLNILKEHEDSEVKQFAYFPDTSNSYQFFDNDLQSEVIDYDKDEIGGSSDNEGLTNHCDFLDAAVSFVIQNKGLTSVGSDYDYQGTMQY